MRPGPSGWCARPEERNAGCGPRGHPAASVKRILRCGRVSRVPPKAVGGDPLTGLAVSAREAAPRADTAPLDWRLLTTADEAPDRTSAHQIRRGYERRGSIERFFPALQVGHRTKDRRQCLAFDAITACRVWDRMRLARERPDDPASRSVPRSECRVRLARARQRHWLGSRDPPDRMTIQTVVALTAGLAGCYPSQRPPMPGTQKLGQGLQWRKADVIGDEAMPVGNDSESND